MFKTNNFFIYLLLMAGVTYLIRAIPLVLIKGKITNRFVLSFLHYIPYTVLSVMTIPAIFYSTSSPVSAVAGLVVAIVLALFERSLLEVAGCAFAAVLIAELVIKYL